MNITLPLRTKQEVHRRWAQVCAQQNWSDGTQVVGNRAVAITRAKASTSTLQEILIHEFQPCNSDPVCAKELGSQAAHPEGHSCGSNSPLRALSS